MRRLSSACRSCCVRTPCASGATCAALLARAPSSRASWSCLTPSPRRSADQATGRCTFARGEGARPPPPSTDVARIRSSQRASAVRSAMPLRCVERRGERSGAQPLGCCLRLPAPNRPSREALAVLTSTASSSRRLSAELRAIPESLMFSSRERLMALGMINRLSSYVGACERLLQTPVPLNYARHTSRFLTLWCVRSTSKSTVSRK